MIKLLLYKSKWRVGSPGVFITPGTYFIIIFTLILKLTNLFVIISSFQMITSSISGLFPVYISILGLSFYLLNQKES